MEEDCRGRAIIIVNQKGKGFDDLPKSALATGKKLRTLFEEQLKFSVDFKSDASEAIIKNYISEVVKDTSFIPEQHAIFFYFIGHGQKGEILTPNGKLKIDKDILLPFNENADHLLAVPKFFFFDCCQGTLWNGGKIVGMGASEKVLLEEYTRRVPTIGNMVIAYSTLPMEKAICIQDKGPLWTNHIIEEMQKDQTIYEVLHHAQAGVIDEFHLKKGDEKKFYGDDPKLEAPNFTSTLYSKRINNFWREAGNAIDSVGDLKGARLESDGDLLHQSTANSGGAAPMSSGKIFLTDNSYANLCLQLGPHAAAWRTIGGNLGFLPGELDIISCNPQNNYDAPKSYLNSLLAQWLQWAPGDGRRSKEMATLKALKDATKAAGLPKVAAILSSSE